jgi:uncharacterized membrane protein
MRSSSIGNPSAKPPQTATTAERPVRSLAKAISWRITGSIDTMILSWLFTGDLTVAAAISLTEVATKMALYYLHERAWNRIPLGRANPAHGRFGPRADDDAEALRTATETT